MILENKNNIFYVYLYLNPFVESDLVINNIPIQYEPFYVGKGKGRRIYSHIDNVFKSKPDTNKHKNNKISMLIREIGYQDYRDKYIIKIYDNLSNDNALQNEYDIMEMVGTKHDVGFGIKRGPLLNATLCGVNNPILFGESNPAFGKSFVDFWFKKYTPDEVGEKLRLWKIKNSNSQTERWSVFNTDKVKVSEFSNKCSTSVKEAQLLHRYPGNVNKLVKYQTVLNEVNINDFTNVNGIEEHYTNFINFYNSIDFLKIEDPYYVDTVINKSKHLIKCITKTHVRNNYIFNYGVSIANDKLNLTSSLRSIAGSSRWTDDDRDEMSVRSKLYWSNITDIDKKALCKKRGDVQKLNNQRLKELGLYIPKTGVNNNNYGNGQAITGKKNGRANQWIIHTPDNKKYYCDGTLKKFRQVELKDVKPNPIRRLIHLRAVDINIGDWYFKKVDRNFINNGYIIYE